jgi:hypothetical protein
MVETGRKIIVGLFEVDKNKASMPCAAGEELQDDHFELDENDGIMPKNGDDE